MGTRPLFPQRTTRIDNERIGAVYQAMRQRATPKALKKHKGEKLFRIQLPFTAEDLRQYARDIIGDGRRCPYCERIGNANFITLANCVFDHKVALKRGGTWDLKNLIPVCQECNNTKGEMSLPAYLSLMAFVRTLPPDDEAYTLKCMRTQGRVMTSFRAGNKEAKKPAPPAPSCAYDPNF